jgi:Fe-S cluster biogenesis protein NfuA
MTMRAEVEKVLDEVRPKLQADGGNIELVDVEGGIVKVKLKGSCTGCPMAQMTLRFGVERYLKSKIPGIQKVEAI